MSTARAGGLLVLVAGLAVLASAAPAGATTIGPILGSWDGTEATQTGRMFRDGTASDGTGSKLFPGIIGATTVYYELFGFYNNGPAGVVTIDVTSTSLPNGAVPPGATFFSAFKGTTYDPIFTNNAPNYLGDAGASALNGETRSFGILAPANSAFFIIANTSMEVPAGIGDTWQFSVIGETVVRGEMPNISVVPEPLTMTGLAFAVCGTVGYLRRRLAA